MWRLKATTENDLSERERERGIEKKKKIVLSSSSPRQRHQEQKRPAANEHGVKRQRRPDGEEHVGREDEHIAMLFFFWF